MKHLLTKIKKSVFLFTYKDNLNRICNRCGTEQRKYGVGLFFTHWGEYKVKGNDLKCKCQRYTIQK